MKNIITTMQECDAILQTLIHDIGAHQVQAADLAIQLRMAANLLDPPDHATDTSGAHGMFQTALVVNRSTALNNSSNARAMRTVLQRELDRYHSDEQDLPTDNFQEVEPATIRAGNRIRIVDITMHYRQWTEFVVHRIEHYPGISGMYYFVSRDDGLRKLIYNVGSIEAYLSRTYYLVDKQQPHAR